VDKVRGRPISPTSPNSLQSQLSLVESARDDVDVRRLPVRGFEVQALLLLLAATAVMLGWTLVDVVVRRRMSSDAD
jgi:hypothetical protein